MAEKKMTVEEVNEYMKKQCGFVPRMFQVINTVTPEPGRTFADFYASIFGDGALSRKVKELMFMSGGVAYCSPRCIIHVIPAINAGANDGEIFEAAAVGMILAGFVPGWRLLAALRGGVILHSRVAARLSTIFLELAPGPQGFPIRARGVGSAWTPP